MTFASFLAALTAIQSIPAVQGGEVFALEALAKAVANKPFWVAIVNEAIAEIQAQNKLKGVHFKGTPSGGINPSPASLEDILTNGDVYGGLLSTFAALNITDPTLIAQATALQLGQSQAGAALLLASNPVDPIVTHGGSDWGVNSTVTPPEMVVVTPVPASTILVNAAPVVPPATS